MGRIGMTSSVGSSVDLDVITAAAGDIVKGKVSVDKNGEPITGTLALSGNATEAYVYSGKTFYSTDPKKQLVGAMPTQGAKTYTPSKSNQTIAAGRYLSGTQTIKGDANLIAANIKKGVTIFGVKGTWEGYVGGVNDIYYKGDNRGQCYAKEEGTKAEITFQSNMIDVTGGGNQDAVIGTKVSYNLTPYTKLNVEYVSARDYASGYNFNLGKTSGIVSAVNMKDQKSGQRYTAQLDISQYDMTAQIALSIGALSSGTSSLGTIMHIHRIWLS